MGGVCYHVLNRSNARQKVFHQEEDYAAFLDLVEQAHEPLPMRLLARCLISVWCSLPQAADERPVLPKIPELEPRGVLHPGLRRGTSRTCVCSTSEVSCQSARYAKQLFGIAAWLTAGVDSGSGGACKPSAPCTLRYGASRRGSGTRQRGRL